MKRKNCEKKFLKFQRQKNENDESFLRLALLCFIIFVPAVFLSRNADAIPVFARKYQTSCPTCHWATFPALNPFGKAFKDNGYRFPEDDEVYVKESPIAFGGPAWKKVFPNAVWPSTIEHLPPVALLINSNFTVNPKNSSGKTAFDGIGAVELLTGGTLGESLAWFGAVGLYENKGKTVESGTGSERFFGVYSPTLFERKGLVNIEFGRFEPRVTPRSEHLSIIGTTPYLFSTWSILPTANFTSFFPSQDGVEFFGGKNGPKGNGGFLWAAGIVNGEANDDSLGVWDGSDINSGSTIVSNTKTQVQNAANPFDVNNSKDYYARVSYKIGGMGVMGGGIVEESKKATENWQEKSLTISSFFYRGNAGFFNNPVNGTGWHSSGNHFWRYGMEADFYWWNFNLFGAATYFRDRTDSNVTIGSESGRNFNADLYTAELRWVALPWVIPAVRFENMNPAYDAGDIKSFNRYSSDITVLIRANVKFVIGAAFTDGSAPKSPFFDDAYRMGVLIGL
ncbi:MAG: hypothetical protein KGJ87_08600 [Planctomycetota bacterium]|nr:hypothetical protein [Planctomycetota bacterium]MDE2217200.1 hypothetical protein [Planctomycetota bacterium]